MSLPGEILNFTEAPIIDESVEKYEFHEYEPVSQTNLNTAGEIRINIELQDLFTHPARSYLQIEGRLTKADCSAYVNADAVALAFILFIHLSSHFIFQFLHVVFMDYACLLSK